MDIQRPHSNTQRNKRIAVLIASVIGIVSVSLLAWSVSNRPPGIDRDLVFWEEVRHGEFLYQVTGQGSLYAPEIRSVTSQSEGVVEVIHVLPGHQVESDDILLVQSSPNLLQELADAEAELESAFADEDLRRTNAKDDLLRLESELADAEDAFEEANFKAESSKLLRDQNAIIEMELMRDVNRANAARRRMDLAEQLVTNFPDKLKAEEAQAESRIERLRRQVDRLKERVRNLEVRAGSDGVVQVVSVEVGQRISSGTEVARVVNPHHLIARISVSERDEPLIELGQSVRLEMGRDSIGGVVIRKDPVVTDRNVTVDVKLVGESERGRQLTPDVTVTGRIQIERVDNTFVVDKPVYVRDEQQRAELFRLDESGNRARLVSVEIGRVSVREMEVLSGLQVGDRILQGDMTDWLDEPILRIH